MTWENYGAYDKNITGTWSIDHIKPKSSYKFGELHGDELEAALKHCWHYTNLQPLGWPEQLSKGYKYDAGTPNAEVGHVLA